MKFGNNLPQAVFVFIVVFIAVVAAAAAGGGGGCGCFVCFFVHVSLLLFRFFLMHFCTLTCIKPMSIKSK